MRVIAVLLAIGFIVAHFWWFAAAVLWFALVYSWVQAFGSWRAGTAELDAARAAVVARCDQQHAWVMAGDPRGTFGENTEISPEDYKRFFTVRVKVEVS